jgi:hypothetical protein
MKNLAFALVALFMLFSCGTPSSSSSEEKASEKKQEEAIEKVTAVSVYDGVPVRLEPSKDGKWHSSLSIGEKLMYLGETVVDTADAKKREYYKVELSDGTVAWAQTYGIVINAYPAAIVETTPVYKRPDLVTQTDKKLTILDFIAVVNEKEEWAEVVGAKKKNSGWINKRNISEADADVAVASMVFKTPEIYAVYDGHATLEVELVDELLQKIPYESSVLMTYLKSYLEEPTDDSEIVDDDSYYEEDEEFKCGV